TVMITAMGVLLYSTNALLPLFLQTLMGYPALQSGEAVSPRGAGAVLGMLIIASLMKRIDPRVLVGTGFGLVATSTFVLGNLTLDVGTASVMWPNVISGLGTAFVFVPLATLSFGTLTLDKMGDGTGVFNLMRNIGGSVGISLSTTLVERASLVHQNMLSGHMTPLSDTFANHVAALGTALGSTAQSYAVVYQNLLQQSAMFAYVDTFRWLALLALATIPLSLMLRRGTSTAPVSVH
ncbi:MAG TPA: MFS transporter, partial [Candidatus Xenobia bacterium]